MFKFMKPDPTPASCRSARQRWMSALARAPREQLETFWAHWTAEKDYTPLRVPETGLVMTRGRAGGTGQRFNLGEITVTRAAVRLHDGVVGHAYVLGRDSRHAELAAVLDALLQKPEHHDALEQTLIAPLVAERAVQRHELSRKAAATKVDFFTLVRGED